MAVRQDWTRLTRSIRSIFLSPHLEPRRSLGQTDLSMVPGHIFLTTQKIAVEDRRLLAEIERRKNPVLVNGVRAQLR